MSYTAQSGFYTSRTHNLLQSGYPVEVINTSFTDANTAMVHQHDEIEFQYISEGQASITCDKDSLPVSKGDIIFINQSVSHALTPAGSGNGSVHTILAHPAFLFGFEQLEMEKKYITPVTHCSTRKHLHITPDSENYTAYLSHIREILALHAKKDAGFELLVKAALLQLWKLLYDDICTNEGFAKAIPHIANQDEQRVRQAILFIQEHFMEPVTLEDIAGSVLISKSECCRCFKRTMNITPFEYLMKYRILESTKRMQKQTQESISEISGAVGFNNTSYYNKVFKKVMGCTPTAYRQSIKKDIPQFPIRK